MVSLAIFQYSDDDTDDEGQAGASLLDFVPGVDGEMPIHCCRGGGGECLSSETQFCYLFLLGGSGT